LFFTTKCFAAKCFTSGPIPLNLSKTGLLQTHPTVVIPFNQSVIVVGLFHGSEVAGRPSEIAQPCNAISRIQLRAAGRRFGERRPFGTIGVWGCAAMQQWRLRCVGKLGLRTG
jgi:hypothetical protein